MAARRLTAVCRDCGEVMHVDLARVQPGSAVACPGCGLLASRLPAPPRPGQARPAPARKPATRARAR